MVSNEHGFTQSMVQKILTFIEDLAVAKVIDDEQDYINYGDEARRGEHVALGAGEESSERRVAG